MDNKRANGQYFTTISPFETVAFKKWFNEIPQEVKCSTILEPFAGSNNIPAMLLKAGIPNSWDCYDIDPPVVNVCPQFNIRTQDTLKQFPKNYKIAITNPPYLGKNSATRRGLPFPDCKYDDLYKFCLEQMLLNVDYVAAIIPETFIIADLFSDRLNYVISLTCKMFEDTECPVCLALFGPNKSKDFEIYQMNEKLGTFLELKNYEIKPIFKHEWKVNDPNGEIGIICVDSNKKASIHFCLGNTIESKKIKVSSRSYTRVSGLPENVDISQFLDKCNQLLDQYRLETKDVFLASFKNLRKDNHYRRRLDFATAKLIMSKAVEEI